MLDSFSIDSFWDNLLSFPILYLMGGSVFFLGFSLYLLFWKPPRPIRKAVMGIGFLLMLGIAYYAVWIPIFSLRVISVPDVTGFPALSAAQFLESRGFRPKFIGNQGVESPLGYVVGQNPPPDSRVRAGRTISLRIKYEPVFVDVPSVLGMKPSHADAELQKVGLRLKMTTEEADGEAVLQYPPPGIRVPAGSEVEVSFSRWTPDPPE